MNKTLIFDMDGTIADFYNYPEWLKCLQCEQVEPYLNCKPIYDMNLLNNIIIDLRHQGWNVGIVTWAAKNCTESFKNNIIKAKKEWLKKYNFKYDFFSGTNYGIPKHSITAEMGGFQVLVDDNTAVRSAWNLGGTIDATQNIIDKLKGLLI